MTSSVRPWPELASPSSNLVQQSQTKRINQYEEIMTPKHGSLFAVLMFACLPLAACKKMEVAEEEHESPAKIEHPNGEDAPAKITIEKQAAERLDLQTDWKSG